MQWAGCKLRGCAELTAKLTRQHKTLDLRDGLFHAMAEEETDSLELVPIEVWNSREAIDKDAEELEEGKRRTRAESACVLLFRLNCPPTHTRTRQSLM